MTDNLTLPPLAPGHGGRSISQEALKVGDIIVSTSSGLTSLSIRLSTGSPVSHAYVYVGNPDGVIEALPEGVLERTIDEALRDDTLAVAFRNPTLLDGQLVANYLTMKLGAKYDYWQAFFAGVLEGDAVRLVELGASRRRYYCSELIVEAFNEAGAPLTRALPGDVLPEQLTLLDLEYVGHLKY